MGRVTREETSPGSGARPPKPLPYPTGLSSHLFLAAPAPGAADDKRPAFPALTPASGPLYVLVHCLETYSPPAISRFSPRQQLESSGANSRGLRGWRRVPAECGVLRQRASTGGRPYQQLPGPHETPP